MKIFDKNWYLYLLDKILKKPNLDNGFIEEPLKDEDWRVEELGAERKVLMAEGYDQGWIKFRSSPELQNRNGSEVMACVTFSAIKSLTKLLNYFKWLTDNNKADDEQKEIVKIFEYFGFFNEKGGANIAERPIAKLSNTTYRGNTFANVANAIRKYGLVPESMWSWVDGWNNYYKNVPQEVIDRGLKLLEFIDFTYEYVNPEQFNDYKKFGTIQTSGYAWNGKDQKGYYKRVDYAKNHAISNDGFKAGEYDNVDDTYEPTDKKVAWNFNFGNGLLWTIHLKKPLCVYNENEIKKLISRGFRYIQRVEKQEGGHGEVYELTNRNTLRELSEQEKMEIGIRALADKKDATGISEKSYKNLFI